MMLKDKVVFITGGAQGFGKAVAEAVLKKGAKVCLVDIKQEEGEITEKELKSSHGQDRVTFVKCDVTSQTNLKGAFKSAVSKFGHVDIMCNNAGIMDESVWERQISINFNAVVYGTDLAIDHMRTDKGGKGGLIVNTASMAALVPCLWFPVYAGTKSAVYNFTHSWAQNQEIKAAGVRFTTICPTGANTALMDLQEHQIINIADFKEHLKHRKFCRVDQVVDGFLQAMEDDEISGGGIAVTQQHGPVYTTLTPGPVSANPSPGQ